MKLLLDTQALIWWAFGVRPIPNKVQKLLEDPSSQVFVSAAALWEIALKTSLKKLSIPSSAEELLGQLRSRTRIQLLEITAEHGVATYDLPMHHKDPFDRIMVAQCIVERLHFVTSDAQIRKYPVRVIW